MRYLVLSDIHSNLEAFQASLKRAEQARYDVVLCCGDIVGYGPDPAEVIDLLRTLNPVCIRGNHDRAAAGLDNAENFNPQARTAVLWTRSVLSDGYRDYLGKLPVGPLSVNSAAQLAHGAVTHEDDYIFTEADADVNFQLTHKNITFFGHSHFPVVFASDSIGQATYAAIYEFDGFSAAQCEAGQKLFINPGSIGQPRDGDPRASFAIWDEEEGRVEFYRVEYNVRRTQEKMFTAQLPLHFIERLARGR